MSIATARDRLVPNLVIAEAGDGGKASIYNHATATVQIVADVNGWYQAPGSGGSNA